MTMSLKTMILVAALAVGAIACGPSRTPDQAAADLQAPSAEVRLKAARDIEASARDHNGLPPNITDRLLERFPSETDPKTRGSMITALGYTGDPRVKPLLEEYLRTSNPDQQRWGARAYKKYVVRTGQLPPDYEFPENWPYGTAGFPPPAQQ
jgi:hypothetical protein